MLSYYEKLISNSTITDNKQFWKTVEPCITDKTWKRERITLIENEKVENHLSIRHLVKHGPADPDPEQRITPGAPRIIPEYDERVPITVEHHGAGQSFTKPHRALWSTCLFNDLVYTSKWSRNRYIWKQILVGKATKFIELSGSFPYKLTPLSLMLDFRNQ